MSRRCDRRNLHLAEQPVLLASQILLPLSKQIQIIMFNMFMLILYRVKYISRYVTKNEFFCEFHK